MKFSDPNYRLPTILALDSFELLETGTTLPMAISGVDQATGEKGHYVVKFKGADRMSETSSAFELLAGWMALELELPVVVPVLIDISNDFIETALRGKDGYRTAAQSIGINYGSEYKPGFSNLPKYPFSLPNNFEELAQLIFIFDLFIANTDRGHQRPNIASNGKSLLIYDHELAFSFSRIIPFARNKTPWKFSETDRELYEKHILYNWMKSIKPDFTHQVEQLKCFDEAFWSKAYKTLPKEWTNKEVLEIQPYLTSIIENLPYFAESLSRAIAI